MIKLVAGLDEIATETKQSEGWCYFCITEADYVEFAADVNTILSNTTELTAFHGKKFIQTQEKEYESFLLLIRKYVEKSTPSILCCTLNNRSYKKELVPFSERVTENVLKQIGVTNQTLIDIAKRLSPGLFTFIRLTNKFGSDYELKIEIDSDDFIKNFSQQNTVIKNKILSADSLLTSLCNTYRNLMFSNSPIITRNGIYILKDQKSFLVQAADVIGNFSNAFLFYKLGNSSKKRQLKGQIFERVFGDFFANDDFTTKVKLIGQNDFEILHNGPYTMNISSTYE